MRCNYDMKRIGWMLFAFGVFVFVLFKTVENFQEYKELKREDESEPMTAVVYEKTAAQDLLYGKTYYMVLLNEKLTGKVAWNLDIGQRAYVEKEEFDKLEIGDTVSGFKIDGTFHNQEDLKGEYSSYYIGLAFVSIYIFGYISYWLSKVKFVVTFFQRMERKKLFNSFLGFLLYGLFYGGMLTGLLFGFYYMGQMGMNAYEKYSDEDRIETTAVVTDHFADRNLGRYADSEYFLALSFENQANETVYLTKEVTSHAYYAYKDQRVPISYSEETPYKIYLQETSWKDVFQIMTTNELMMYYIVLFITVALIYVFICWRRFKKTGSYFPVKKGDPPLSK
ncbi:hypothetical protein ACQKL6_05540 [Peribacillus sp. NPDC097197]|uniref:hypothetical protein n=1 Tax=Peribacillus sp. NPDC097197 TaxID=3390615 RepID=UPI003D08F8E0